MEYRRLGRTDVEVSLICLGSMTWGEQNSEREAHEQLDAALAAGVNFIDTAEMYPVPPRAETCGLTERYLGSWLQKRGKREQLVIATKVASRADWLPYIRSGELRLDRRNITEALHASLRRLQTDYIDLYQLHWPERSTNFFGRLEYVHEEDEVTTPLLETLQVLNDLVREGKVRYIGLSNETPWGVMRFLELAQTHDLARVVSIQNPYNLLNRSFEIGLAEVAHREGTGLLAYSPLAFGVLSGKYLDGASPAGARLTRYERFARYRGPIAERATAAYVRLAQRHGLDAAQMALAFIHGRPFVTSTIIGATSMAQLNDNLASADIKLGEEVLQGIELIHREMTNPCP